MFWVVVPVTVRPSHSVPVIVPRSEYVKSLTPGALVRVQVIGPTKLPVKIVPFGSPYLPTPLTINVEPTDENCPPVAIEPLPEMKAPVEKLTEPKSCPGGATMPSKLFSCDPLDVLPPRPIEIGPIWLVRLIHYG